MSQYNPYESSPHSPFQKPPQQLQGDASTVMMWQMVYVVAMLLLYLLVTAGGIAATVFAEDLAAQDPELGAGEMRLIGGIYGAIGGVCALVYAVGLVWKRGMGGWVYNIILIAIGITSCCTWPATIPLLIYWIKYKDQIVGS